MSHDPRTEFLNIIEQSLRLGVIDICTVIYWQVNQIPSDQVLQDLEGRIRARKAATA